MKWETKREEDMTHGYYWYKASNWLPCVVHVVKLAREGVLIDFFGIRTTFHFDELEKFNPKWKGPLKP